MLKGKEWSGGNNGKERITIMIGANISDTEKTQVIGRW